MGTEGLETNDHIAEEALITSQPLKRTKRSTRTESGLANTRKKRTSNGADKKYSPAGQTPTVAINPPFNPLAATLSTVKLYPESAVPPQGNAYFPACTRDFDPNKFQEAMRGLQVMAKERITKTFTADKQLELQIEQEIWNKACQKKIGSGFSLEGTVSSRLLEHPLEQFCQFLDIPAVAIKRYRELIYK